MAGYQNILLDTDPVQYIARLTINRPQRRNALNDLAVDELGDALEDVDSDDSIRVLVVTGAGQAFCAGGDLEAPQVGSEPGAWVSENLDDIRRGFRRVQRFMLACSGWKNRSSPRSTGPQWGHASIWKPR